MDQTGLGTLARHGDRWTLTFTRRLAHPREKVWRAVTEPEHLAMWYPPADRRRAQARSRRRLKWGSRRRSRAGRRAARS